MEIALPHIVVRICGPGIGTDIVAALSLHPLEVSEARDPPEAQRVSMGRPPVLVVVVDPPDPAAAVVATRSEFPGVPILLLAEDGEGSPAPDLATADGPVDSIHAGQPLDELCWLVLEAVSRAARRPGVAEHPLGPKSLEIDGRGIVADDVTGRDGLLFDGRRVHAGDSILPLVDPWDRVPFVAAIAGALRGETRFSALRILDVRGGRHAAVVGLRRTAAGRIGLLVQPLVSGGAIVGRHVDNRDPITGLLTRWAMSFELETRAPRGRPGIDHAFLVMLRIDDCAAVAHQIGHRQTDVLLSRVAAALVRVFPYPALGSRLMGDTFLVFLPSADVTEAVRSAEHLIRAVNGIDVPGIGPGFALKASIGIAAVAVADHDLAIRLAEAAAAEAQVAGGNQAVVAGSATFTPAQADEFTADMDLGSWEVWLQPVMAAGASRPAFHESLARFDAGRRRVVSRADFFVAGRAAGLLERFDRMMLLRVLAILAAHADARISVNVSHETFMAETFPTAFLDAVRSQPGLSERIILEIAPRCLSAPTADVHTRLAALADAGIVVAIDDFGSGICRLAALTQFPLGIVKLDELVTGYIDDDPLQREFVRTVVSLCRARGITTVAEYTRSPEQLARLVDDGVDLFQGELFGMPRPAGTVLPAGAVAAGT